MINRQLELFYTLFLISGYFKGYIRAYSFNLPIDITLLSAMILVLYMLKILYSDNVFNRHYLHTIVLLFVFYAWILFSSFYTSSTTYWQAKLILFLTNIIAFILPLITYKFFNYKKFFKLFIIIITILNLNFILFILPNIYTVHSFYEMSGMYLTVSLTSGLNVLILLIEKVNFKSTYLFILFITANFLTLIMSGGRGGILFTFIILFLYFINQLAKKRFLKLSIKKIIMSFVMLIILFLTSYIYIINNDNAQKLINRSITRLELLSSINNENDKNKSVNERIILLNFSFEKIFNDIQHLMFGYGIGSFSVEYNGIDGRGYPHNILVEILFELGVIGIFFFLVFYFYIFKNYKNTLIIWFVLYMTLHVLKSSSLVDIRLFFGIIAIMIISSNNKINILNNNRSYR